MQVSINFKGHKVNLFLCKLDRKKKQNRKKIKNNLAHAGLEPATFALLARRSNQLS